MTQAHFSSPATKVQLREIACRQIAKLSLEQRTERSARACALLRRQRAWQQASSVLFYAPLPQELDVWPLLQEALQLHKSIALPRYVQEQKVYTACQVHDPIKDLTPGVFGIREPAPHCAGSTFSELDLILVPGLAFDLHGGRLGRGKGFYDRLLAVVRGKTCGVAFDEQIVSTIPIEPHDRCVDCILTPTRWIEL